MNITDLVKTTFDSLFDDNEQALNEHLIEFATFFYKVDRRISFEEQQFIDEFLKEINWNSGINIESFHSNCIAKINDVLAGSEQEVAVYLSDLMESISKLNGVEKAKQLAKDLSDADGEVADDEMRFLELVRSY